MAVKEESFPDTIPLQSDSQCFSSIRMRLHRRVSNNLKIKQPDIANRATDAKAPIGVCVYFPSRSSLIFIVKKALNQRNQIYRVNRKPQSFVALP
jgi:hypothetical protein